MIFSKIQGMKDQTSDHLTMECVRIKMSDIVNGFYVQIRKF